MNNFPCNGVLGIAITSKKANVEIATIIIPTNIKKPPKATETLLILLSLLIFSNYMRIAASLNVFSIKSFL